MDDQNKNLILATALSFLVILVWFVLFPPSEPTPPDPATIVAAGGDGAALLPPPAIGEAAGVNATPTGTAAPASANAPAAEAARAAPRVAIETARLRGSISLRGGRLDDLSLVDYRETLDPAAPVVRLLSPVGESGAYYALHGWAPAGALAYDDVPGANTLWTAPEGARLTPETPLALRWDNGKGLIFTCTIAVDANYLFTITQSVRNTSAAPVRLAPYGLIARHGMPDNLQRFYILHEGAVQMADGTLTETKYTDMEKAEVVAREGGPAQVSEATAGGWIGFTDKYWMTALAPAPGTAFTAVSKYVPGPAIYQTEARLPALDVAAGAEASVTTRVFAGAKEWETIRAYQRAGIDRFIDAIDWGWFFFFTKPIFAVLHFLNGLIGNMGWSVMALTLFLKALVLPLAYKSYVSMARMKELQPEMEALKERVGDDRQKLQQEMMKLYKEKKVNPAAGCLPVLIQIPIFFSLYKVIFVTIELRQAPWLGWIRDLSAPDPSSILNLFGLLSFAPPGQGSFLAILSLGVLPILLGISMWLQQKLNPAPTDPTQKMIFAWMPWVFMFMLGRFASGLVLYWITNNVITFVQQYAIMRSHGHHPDIFGNIRAGFRKGTKGSSDGRGAGAGGKPANSPRPPAPPRKGTGRGGK